MTSAPEIFQQICIIGDGPVAAAICSAAQSTRAAKRICRVDIDAETSPALRDEAITITRADIQECVKLCDCVFICTTELNAVAEMIGVCLRFGSIVCDTSATKCDSVTSIHRLLPEHVSLVSASLFFADGAHSGLLSSGSQFPEIFCISTPLCRHHEDDNTFRRLNEFWKALGLSVYSMTARERDLWFAMNIYMPAAIAYTLRRTSHALDVQTFPSDEAMGAFDNGPPLHLRVNGSSHLADLSFEGKTSLLEIMSRFCEDLAYLSRAIRWDHRQKIETFLSNDSSKL